MCCARARGLLSYAQHTRQASTCSAGKPKCGGFFFLGVCVKYAKPSLTFEQQADLLLSRGLVADRETLVRRLGAVSYYRLSAYWYPYRDAGSDNLRAGTDLEVVWDHYVFDRQLRLLVMDAVERIEVSIKTRVTQKFSQLHGPFGHIDRANLPGISLDRYRQLMDKVRTSAERSKEAFVEHYFNRYTSETDLPLWVAVEIMDFGSILTMFRHMDHYSKREIAEFYGVKAGVFESWLMTLNYVRNICAHHSRLWNRILSTTPAIPRMKHNPEFHPVTPIRADKVYGVLCILRFLLRTVAPQSKWQERLVRLVEEKHPDIPLRWMGFPDNWKDEELWR